LRDQRMNDGNTRIKTLPRTLITLNPKIKPRKRLKCFYKRKIKPPHN